MEDLCPVWFDFAFKQGKGLLFFTKVNWIYIKQVKEIIPKMSEWIKQRVSRTFFTIINFNISMKFDFDSIVVYYYWVLTARTTLFKLKEFGFTITVYAGIAAV